MTSPTRYADVEQGTVNWLATHLGVRGVTERPANLADVVPLVEVYRLGGSGTVITIDGATLDIDCYHSTRDSARELAYRMVDAMIYDYPATVIPGGLICGVICISGPTVRPYDNTGLRRVGATFHVTIQAKP